MNKSAQSQMHQQPTDTTTTAPSTEISGVRSGAASGGFTMPIAKADLTARAKPALLLNLVNQLPKQRATCGSIKPQQQKRQQESTPPRSTPPAPRAGSSPIRAQVQAQAPPAAAAAAASAPLAKSPPPLIVLENKVLAPNEKIDLRALRLPNGQSAAVPPSALTIVPTTPNETRNADNLKEPMGKAKDILGKLQGSSAPVKKMILNVNKLKVPREELAQLAKEVRKQAMQHVQQQKQPSTDIPAIIPVPAMGTGLARSLITTPSPSTTKICSTTISQVASTSSAIPSKTTIPPSSLITPIVKTCPSPMMASADETGNNHVSLTATTSRGKPTSSTSSSVEVKAEPESDELSAVDFIEQLTAKKDADPNNYLELSAEELSMNAKFGSSHSSNPAPVTVRPEDYLPIGKILQMQDMDILHATLNVNGGNKPNVLCISPNAIKLQSSARPEETESPVVDDKDAESTSISKFQPLKVTAPKHVYTNTKRKTPLSTVTSLVETSPTPDETKDIAPVCTVEAECAKEKPQPVKPVPYKPKRGKVNLVQRNKKASAPKPNETNIATKVAEEPFQVPDTEISSDIAEVTRETPADKETAPKATGNKEQSQHEAAEQLAEIIPVTEDLNTAKKIEKIVEDVEDVESIKADKIVISNKTESVITEEAADGNKTVMNSSQMNLAKERDLTQLYHPPKLPKHKQNPLKPEDNQNEEHTPAIVSLFDAVKREPAPPQGKPQLPFRSSAQNDERPEPMNRTFADALGIQNLVTQLAAEKVVPPQPSQGKEVKSEETAKLPRKKLVKTRPVLSTKRSAKAAQTQATAAESKKVEPLVPRKRPLIPESQHRVKTSSTSDDDGDMFHGFDNGASSCKRFKHSEEKETDISDDASPDYDELEEQPLPDMELSAKKTKTESVVNNTQTASIHTDAGAVNPEDAEPMEIVEEDTLKKTASKKKAAMQEPESQQKAKRPRTASAKVKEAKKKTDSKWKVKVKGSAPANENPSTECAKEQNVSNGATPEETGMKEPIIVKKKRGRPRKSAVIADTTNTSLSESANPLDSSADCSMPPMAASTPDAKRRGRKTKDIPTADNENISESCRQTNDFYHRLLLTRSRQQLVSGEELREDNAGEGELQCGLCLVRCEKADWRSHLGEHYGVGWLIEEPAPLLTRSFVLKMMKTYLDAGSKRLNCRLCRRSLTSALGMMLHLEGCGIKERTVDGGR
uniref:CG11008-PA n=1 Tax=Drosophila virilis TaxID=7244 RepID=Q8I174_DROVI|nr:CG11008-PA [Drosophila virilis]